MDASICPVCEKPRKSSCKCPRGDSKCENGHTWHVCTVHQKIVLGSSDHSLPTNTCTCGVGSRLERVKSFTVSMGEARRIIAQTEHLSDEEFQKFLDRQEAKRE